MNTGLPASLEIRAQEIFFEALDLSADEERAQFVEDSCDDDPRLRDHVNGLLQAHETSGDRFLTPKVPALIAEQPGDRVGRFELVRQIGEGGFGIVYEAEQLEPVKRRVALKIIKPGMDTREVIARFEAERQALALLDHPHIAKIFDAGATESGRPYFAMELVGGVPITHYCNESDLPIRERLSLFVAVCRAVQHAHQKGMIHRDLKPSNVLVVESDNGPAPRIIDFGIAKITSGQGSVPDLTLSGQFLGTPLYMSPEQASTGGGSVDTRSDVYALGAMLFELLSGSPPISPEKLKDTSPSQIERIIAEANPPAPSARMRQDDDGGEGQRRSFDRDLDWIALKALEKDPDRRYQTVSELALDLERFLDHQPVLATPPSSWYRLNKFVRRHRVSLAAAAAVVIALSAGTAVSAWQAYRATQAEGLARGAETLATERLVEAEQARYEAEETANFLASMFMDLDPQLRGRVFSSEDLLDKAVNRLKNRFDGGPAAKVHLLNIMGNSYNHLGYRAKAADTLDRALELGREQLSPEHPERIESLFSLASIYEKAVRNGEARQLCEEALGILGRIHGPDHASIIDGKSLLAHIAINEGKPEEAIALREHIVDRHRRLEGSADQATLFSMNKLAFLLARTGRQEDAIAIYREVIETSTGKERPRRENQITALNAIAQWYTENGEPEKALVMLQKVEAENAFAKKDHAIRTGTRIGDAWLKMGETGKAIEKFEGVLNASREHLGNHHSGTLAVRLRLAEAFCDAGEPSRALSHVEAVVATQRETLGSKDASLAWSLHHLSRVRRLAGDEAGWVAALEEKLVVHESLPERQLSGLCRTMEQLIKAYEQVNRKEDAKRMLADLEKLSEDS